MYVYAFNYCTEINPTHLLFRYRNISSVCSIIHNLQISGQHNSLAKLDELACRASVISVYFIGCADNLSRNYKQWYSRNAYML